MESDGYICLPVSIDLGRSWCRYDAVGSAGDWRIPDAPDDLAHLDRLDSQRDGDPDVAATLCILSGRSRGSVSARKAWIPGSPGVSSRLERKIYGCGPPYPERLPGGGIPGGAPGGG